MESDLISLLSPQSTIREQISAAQSQIAFLKQRGGAAAKDADYFSQILAKKIKAQDKTIANDLKRLSLLDVQNIKDTSPQGATKEEPQYPDNLARGITDLLEMSDANAIRINPALVRDAAESLTKNDAKSQKSIYGRIKEEFESKSKIQSEEDKDLITLANGIQVLQGKRSGTRYSADGMPISSGEVNTKPFNESLWSSGGGMVGGDKTVSQFGASPESAGAVIDPGIYASPVTQKETSQKEKEKNILRAGGLYREGKREEALAVLNSVGISGMYGGGMMPQELDSYFQGIEQNQPSESAVEENKPQSLLTPEQKKRLEEARKKRLEAEAANQ